MKKLRIIPILICAFIGALIFSTPSCRKDCPIVDDPTDTLDTIDPVPPHDYGLDWPTWMFKHWVWEDESTQQSAQALVDDYLAHDIPVGAIIIDSPWETGYNTFDWDTSMYADPQAMVDYFHARDVKVFIWITGAINTDVQPEYNYARDNGYFMKQFSFSNGPAVVDWWKGSGSLIDWWNPDAVAWWKTLMDKTLDLGIDGWKVDGTDYYAVTTPYSPAQDGNVSRQDYSRKYYEIFHEYTRERLGKDRVNTARPIDNYGLSNNGGDFFSFADPATNWCGWVGDQDATFEGLVAALNNMYWSDDYGYLAFGSDIGGYREDNNFPGGRSKEVFIRWAQLGAFSPIMENGGGGEHRPWMFDQETEDIYRNLVLSHHDMIDYLMTNSETYFAEGRSLMEFFNNTDYSYMLGPDIFVAPMLEAGNSITVNFPAGEEWVYLYDKNVTYQGGQTHSLTVPLDEYPVFIKQGSIMITRLKSRS